MPIRQTTRLALPAALLALAGAAQAADTTFTFKGYVKADALFSRCPGLRKAAGVIIAEATRAPAGHPPHSDERNPPRRSAS